MLFNQNKYLYFDITRCLLRDNRR